jgi:hypothetical protein
LIDVRLLLLLAFLAAVALVSAQAAPAGTTSLQDRVEELQQELDSLSEDIEDLQEPVGEFDLFDQCMFVIGVSQYGRPYGHVGYLYGSGGHLRWPALAMDMRGFGSPQYEFLAFPQEEPPSIECNEDAGQEESDN